MHSQHYRIFREMLVHAREAAGLTQVEVARRLGRPQSFVSKCERGERRVDVAEFAELADVLAIDMNGFFEAYRERIEVLAALGGAA